MCEGEAAKEALAQTVNMKATPRGMERVCVCVCPIFTKYFNSFGYRRIPLCLLGSLVQQCESGEELYTQTDTVCFIKAGYVSKGHHANAGGVETEACGLSRPHNSCIQRG